MLKFNCPECSSHLALNGSGVISEEPKQPTREFVLYYLKEYCGTNSGKGIAGGFSRFGAAAKSILGLCNNDIMLATKALDEISKEMRASGLSWTLDTIVKNYASWKQKYQAQARTQPKKEKCNEFNCYMVPTANSLYCKECEDARKW